MFLKAIQVIFTITLMWTIGCVKKIEKTNAPQNPNGGQDSGGGDTLGSRKALVDFYLSDEDELKNGLGAILRRLSRRLSVADEFLKNEITINLKNKFLTSINQTLFDFDPKAKSLTEKGYFKKLNLSRIDPYSEETVHYMYDNILSVYNFHNNVNLRLFDNALEQIEFDIKENEPCIDRYKNKKTGSVSDSKLSIHKKSVICISKKRLLEVSEDSLFIEIYGLLLHEFLHLLDLNESEAFEIQQYVIVNNMLHELLYSKVFLFEYLAVHTYGNYIKLFLSDYNERQFLLDRNNSRSKLNYFFDILSQHVERVRRDISYQQNTEKMEKFLNKNNKTYSYNGGVPQELHPLYAELFAILEVFYGMPSVYFFAPSNIKMEIEMRCQYLSEINMDITDNLTVLEKVTKLQNAGNKDACEDSKEIKDSDIVFIFHRLKFLSEEMSKFEPFKSSNFK